MHPYRESTVPGRYLIIGIVLPMTVIVITELTRFRMNIEEKSKVKLFNRDFPIEALNVYKLCGIFLFGLSVTVLTTQIGKYMLGRFRPHFMEVCKPVMLDGTNCTDSINLQRYIEDFTCGNEKSSAVMLEQMRLSFPSGHSSIAMFSMLFTSLYLQHKMTWGGSKLLKHLLQFGLMVIALYTAMSRVSDYKHHCKFFEA